MALWKGNHISFLCLTNIVCASTSAIGEKQRREIANLLHFYRLKLSRIQKKPFELAIHKSRCRNVSTSKSNAGSKWFRGFLHKHSHNLTFDLVQSVHIDILK